MSRPSAYGCWQGASTCSPAPTNAHARSLAPGPAFTPLIFDHTPRTLTRP
jgi:hypothetical protein